MPPPRPRVVIAPNAFKGSCPASAAARAIASGVADAWPRARSVLLPMADGGDGFLAATVAATGGRISHHSVSGPLGGRHRGPLGWLGGPGPPTAVVELAAACGLALVGRPTPETSLRASTRGAGELVRIALDRGAERLMIGLGGSASTDGGAGLLRALGLRCLDARGRPLGEGGGALPRLTRIDRAELDPRLRRLPIVVACDVRNPLLGARGAAFVYAPQKGAGPAAVVRLERGLQLWAAVLGEGRAGPGPLTTGAGAAGGTAFGLAVGLGARLESGAEVVAAAIGLTRALRGADRVLTGEGRLDGQSLRGKATQLVAERAAEFGVPCAVLAGSLDPRAERRLARLGVAALTLGDGPRDLDAALSRTRADLRRAASRVCRLWDPGGDPGSAGQPTGVHHSRYFSTSPRTTSK